MRDRIRRWLVGTHPGFARRLVVASAIGGAVLGLALPSFPEAQVTLIAFDGRLSMALLGLSMATWAAYQTDGLLPALAPPLCLELGLFLGQARVFVSVALTVGFLIGGFGSFLGASLRRVRGPPGERPPDPEDL